MQTFLYFIIMNCSSNRKRNKLINHYTFISLALLRKTKIQETSTYFPRFIKKIFLMFAYHFIIKKIALHLFCCFKLMERQELIKSRSKMPTAPGNMQTSSPTSNPRPCVPRQERLLGLSFWSNHQVTLEFRKEDECLS